MNAFIWLLACVGLQWLATYLFVTVKDTALGFIVQGLFFVGLLIMVQAFLQDVEEWFGPNWFGRLTGRKRSYDGEDE